MLHNSIYAFTFLLFLAFSSVVFMWLRTLAIIKSPEFFILLITCSVFLFSAGVIYIYIRANDPHLLRLPAGVAGFGFALFLALMEGRKRR